MGKSDNLALKPSSITTSYFHNNIACCYYCCYCCCYCSPLSTGSGSARSLPQTRVCSLRPDSGPRARQRTQGRSWGWRRLSAPSSPRGTAPWRGRPPHGHPGKQVFKVSRYAERCFYCDFSVSPSPNWSFWFWTALGLGLRLGLGGLGFGMNPNIRDFLFKGPASCIQSSTLPSSMRNKRILKSSLSKTSSLKRNTTNKFETKENLQQIVKQKRENCLQVKNSFPQGQIPKITRS